MPARRPTSSTFRPTASSNWGHASSSESLGASHGIDLSGPRRQGSFGPALATILTGEHLAAAGRTVHPLRLSLVEGEGEHGGPGLHAHIHPSPARAAVSAAEQDADVALETSPGCHPDGLRIAWHLANITAVGLPLGIQRLEPGAGPVRALVRAAEQAGAADGKNRPRTPAPDEHAVHIDGVIVHVLAMAHVLPVLTAVEAPDDTADFDGAIDFIGIGRIDGQLQDTLGRVGAGGNG